MFGIPKYHWNLALPVPVTLYLKAFGLHFTTDLPLRDICVTGSDYLNWIRAHWSFSKGIFIASVNVVVSNSSEVGTAGPFGVWNW